MEELSLENILSEEQLAELEPQDETQEEKEPQERPKEEKNTDSVAEVDSSELFADEEPEKKPESVGERKKEEDKKGEKDTDSAKAGTPPTFYSSIAYALVEDGIFQNLDDKDLSKVETPEDFARLMDDQIRSQLDERQKRIDEALEAGVEPSRIRKYENIIGTLDKLTDESLSDESDKGEKLRRSIIYQDYINRGFSDERAKREVEKSFKNATDIEDAKEALQSNRDFYKSNYDALVKEAEKDRRRQEEAYRKEAEQLRKSVMETEKVMGDIELDRQTRQKVYDSIMKPVYTDPETGDRLTAIQKYEMEHRVDFLKNVGLLFVLTDGFTKLDTLVQGKVKKEVRKGLRELENTLNGTSRNADGSFRMMNGTGGDNESKDLKYEVDI